MNLVLLSGGSGKRLWPLSNDARSKQFLKLLANEKGEPESMVQRVWRQLEGAGLNGSAVIATGKAQLDLIKSQIGEEAPVIVEPERRDTFPAIALAASYLYTVKQAQPDETVVVLPVDPYVEGDFFTAVKKLGDVLEAREAELALLGVTPAFPSVKYGYIVPFPDEAGEEVMKVSHFREKPNEELAEKLIADGALWNCGVFAFKLEYIISLLREMGLPLGYEELLARYGDLPKISFDYQVVEKARRIVVKKYEGAWKDLGTWNTLTEEMASPLLGKGFISEDCRNTHLVNELDIPVTVLGVRDLVVAASPDGILICDKKSSPRVKDYAAKIEQRPMYEERRWGWYRVLDYVKYEEGIEVLTKRIGITAGKNLSYQVHYKRGEVWTIIRGEGEFACDGAIMQVKAGDVLHIPVRTEHGIKAISDLELIEVQTGSSLVEEDIVRLYLGWGEVEAHCRKLMSRFEEAAAGQD